ncbi:P-loop containing nucleoside triphosphate hydrolase protein [Neocallimastix sp. 'constans']
MFLKKKEIPVPNQPQPTPYTKASFLSRITYWWINPLFTTGHRRPLEDNDLYLLDPKFEEKKLTENFYREWNKELIKRKDKPNIVKTFIRVFGPKWIPSGILKFLSDCCNLTSPIILELLLDFVSNEETEESYKGWIYAVSMLLLQIAATFSINTYFELVMEVGLSVRATIIGIMYRKMLKLSQNAKQHLTEGQIINIVSSDSSRIQGLLSYLHYLWSGPFQLVVILALLIRALGLWALIGFSIFVVLIPIQGLIMKWLTSIREQTVIFTDERVKKTQEIIGSMRVIKFFGWESSFLNIINKLRSKEISRIRKSLIIYTSTNSLMDIIPVLASSLTYIGYALAGNTLTAAKVFSTLAYFQMLSFPLGILPMVSGQLADTVVALRRINNVINGEELDELPTIDTKAEYAILVKNGNFIWETKKEKAGKNGKKIKKDKNNKKKNEQDITNIGENKENQENEEEENNNSSQGDYEPFKIKNINLNIPRNSLTAIVGTVGSGKSSLINALIGEMKRESGEVTFGGTIGYCSQQAWIQNATVKDNILFGKEYDEEKYNNAVKSCALLPDFKIFPKGDRTEIGERGINLSGGQKQRINLARAVYFNSDIVFLDDPLSAVDAHVSRYLFDKCILGALGNKTRILVTHQLHVLPSVDYVIYIDNGCINEQGTYSELMGKNGEFARLMRSYGGIDENNNGSESEEESELLESEQSGNGVKKEGDKVSILKETMDITETLNQENQDKEKDKGLMTAEERNTGSVKFSIYKFYVRAAGGLGCVIAVLFFLILTQVAKLGNDLWLVFWTDKKFDISTLTYVIIYLGWSGLKGIAEVLFGVIICYTGLIAAGKIHRDAIARVMSAPISFFDTTPLGRIINRFSKDQDSVDGILIESIQSFLSCFAVTLSTLFLIIYATPIFLVALIPLLLIYYLMQEYYRNTSREVKRLDSLARSPLYANFTETMNGLSTIRAYREQGRFIDISDNLMDNNNRPCILQITAQRWLGLRLETIGAFLVFFAAISGLILRKSISPALLGLSLSYSLSVTGNLNWAVRQFSETEVHMNAAERLSYYANEIESENQTGLDAPKDWPKQGKIEIKDLTMKYAPHLPPVLNNISLNIQANEKIGVVGRTGAGKSSIVMTLFRLVEPETGSSIKIDDVSIMDIKLCDLRRRISIIPQDPILFSGTIRFNMDPFDEHSDQEIWTALEHAGLKNMVSELENKLESEVRSNGENFSVGQRQLLCLARAMIRQSKILVMDEATASVDVETDAIIQKALRSEFQDVTVITIAHRLNTIIDYDKVLVLSQGNILEYDKPSNLLFEKTADGNLVPTDKTEFSKLVDETGPVNAELLRKLALSN